ncbi:hypothetical protein BPOR_0817g00070 [Botrytis porri]|uniref:Uncharacterized protein n=1 Tax=Botrytis porri TaxID=87229 RepID=A0A4Z1KG25_9HELO|nr:hypothetical protein BPOR_0817g00070 [Botrytis porri]
MRHGSKVDRRLQSEGVNGTRTLWVTRRRAIESSDGQEKEKQQWLQWQESDDDQGRSPDSRLLSAFDFDEDPEDNQPSKKRQRTARNPSDASLSGDFASSPPTYGGSGRMLGLSRGAEVLEEQKHEVQWLAMEQRDRFEGLTEEMDESNRLNGDLAAKMSRIFKEQKDWEKTVNARLDHKDSSIDAKTADMEFMIRLFRLTKCHIA